MKNYGHCESQIDINCTIAFLEPVVISKGGSGGEVPLVKNAHCGGQPPQYFALVLLFKGCAHITLLKIKRQVLFCLLYYLVCCWTLCYYEF